MPRKRKKKSRTKAVSKRKAKTRVSARTKVRKARATAKKKRRKKPILGRGSPAELVAYETRGLGAQTGGQAGDTQGLSGAIVGGSESVRELLEEGQSYEAEVLEGVENARDADESEVKTREVPEDDVPEEYRGKG